MRYIGVDLHKTNFVVCFLSDDETTRTQTYRLTKAGITRFITELDAEDEVAVEVTANIYYFYDQVKPHVARVVLVDTYGFSVIAKSKKKTDKADASALARFLKLDYLPSVPVPSERVRQLRHLLQARETLVGMRTKLKNMAHGALTRNGVALSRSAFATRLSRAHLAKRDDLAPADARGRKRLRTVAISAVLSMVNRTHPPLMEFYQKKKKEKGSGKAICATARKLLTIIFVMLKKELDYWYLEDRLYNRKLRLLSAAA